jgi:hypothetical protein
LTGCSLSLFAGGLKFSAPRAAAEWARVEAALLTGGARESRKAGRGRKTRPSGPPKPLRIEGIFPYAAL